MARSKAQCRADRAEQADTDIRIALGRGDSKGALYEAWGHVMGEAVKLREDRAGDGAYTDAELAASLLLLGNSLHAYKPATPPGFPVNPQPHDLAAAFEAALDRGRRKDGRR